MGKILGEDEVLYLKQPTSSFITGSFLPVAFLETVVIDKAGIAFAKPIVSSIAVNLFATCVRKVSLYCRFLSATSC